MNRKSEVRIRKSNTIRLAVLKNINLENKNIPKTKCRMKINLKNQRATFKMIITPIKAKMM